MDPNDPRNCDALDLRSVWRALPSYGAAWDAAIELGIDVVQLEYNLSLTPTERLLQHHEMARTFERLHGVALAEHPELITRLAKDRIVEAELRAVRDRLGPRR